ncbi:MAG TPA: flavodoxin family protein [Synergistaceae bacterium]|nr:flavodoxin family protein [Synergistaceae bacterium]HPJ26285.1 flavodoxin family protein [Synergistaceae bacterium]HPQ37627.1 flavodoxin family protein [Synergistaceae bacterium]
MYVVALSGSPRKGGNTETLLRHVLEPLQEGGWETELLRIGGEPMRGCLACRKCFENKNRRCVIEGDIFNGVVEKMFRADAIVLGSPTYFTDVTAEMKALIDRAGYVSMANGRAFTGKIGAAVVAVRRAGALQAFDTMNHLFLISRMIVPGSSYWNVGVGLAPGDVEKDTEGLENMNHLGRAIRWLGERTAPYRDSYPR